MILDVRTEYMTASSLYRIVKRVLREKGETHGDNKAKRSGYIGM